MLSSLKEVVQFMNQQAIEAPKIKERLFIASPGVEDKILLDLRTSFPTLPTSYIEVVHQYDVRGICIGYYQISPIDHKLEDFVKEMIQINDRNDNPNNFQAQHDLVYFGSDGFDEFYVAGTQSDFKEGEILAIDHELYWEDNVPIVKVAPSYEMFLILCANKYELEMTEGMTYEASRAEMQRRVDALNLDPEYKGYWLR